MTSYFQDGGHDGIRKKTLRLCRIKWDWNEIQKGCSSSKQELIDVVGFLIGQGHHSFGDDDDNDNNDNDKTTSNTHVYANKVHQRTIQSTQNETSLGEFIGIFTTFPQKAFLVPGDVVLFARIEKFSPLIFGVDPLLDHYAAKSTHSQPVLPNFFTLHYIHYSALIIFRFLDQELILLFLLGQKSLIGLG